MNALHSGGVNRRLNAPSVTLPIDAIGMATMLEGKLMSVKNALMATIHKVDGKMMTDKLRAAAQAALLREKNT